jgi:peptide/nickel transport system substrate-binding protein
MWQERPGIMKAREFVADDVIYAFDRLMSSRKRIPQFHDFIKRIEAKDKHTVVFHLNEWNADWPYYIGHGYYNAIQAREQEQAQGGAGRWENACGTGPFMIDQYKAGHSLTYVKNPNYWDTELIGGKKYQIPFVDRAVGMLFKDPQTLMSALRTGRLDTVMTIGWRDMQELKRTTPQLIWSKSLGINATMIALRFDKKPFDDIRVRRALNMAINRKALSDTFAGGESVLVNVPFPYLFEEVYTPLEKLPPAARELFAYDPEKARKLLAEAGYPKGFSFKCTYGGSSSETIDFLSMIAANLSKIGVTMEINVMDYPSSISRMTKKVHDEGMLVSQDHATPLVIMRRMFVTGQTWNPSMISEKYIDDLYHRISTDRKLTDKQRNGELKKFGVYTLENVVPGILLSGSYVYTAWWPWVKNYHGELRVGIHRAGPIYARIWIDHELKKKMGY